MTACSFCDKPLSEGSYALCDACKNQSRPVLHWLLKRWTIQRRHDSEWEVSGTVLRPRSASAAVLRARSIFEHEAESELRAVYWWDTEPSDRDVAIYEANHTWN